jgi:hypothetical protein
MNIDAEIRALLDSEPIHEQSIHGLKNTLTFIKLIREISPYAQQMEALIETEISDRISRGRNGPSFTKGDRVRVVESMPWWPIHSSPAPPVGIIGKVIRASVNLAEQYKPDPDEYVGSVVVRLLSTDVGYIWEKGDDLDRKYVTYYIPNYVLEKVS